MIRSFPNKGLRELFREGRSREVPSALQARIRRRLDVLDQANDRSEVDLPGYELHRLEGRVPPRYAIGVNGPWRITFVWHRGDAIAVDLERDC